MQLEKQVNRNHYQFKRYVQKNHRWVSYYHQIDEILSLPDIASVLEVGPGAPLVRDMLTYHAPHISYQSIDIAEDLQPDIVGSVTDMPIEDNAYDVVCAFQILEHIPFEDFDQAIAEIARVTRRYAIISLPHFGPSIKLQLKIPLFPMLQFAIKIPYPKKHIFNGQHYWEIGKRGYSARRIRAHLQKMFSIKREYIPYENQCHRFYVLAVNT